MNTPSPTYNQVTVMRSRSYQLLTMLSLCLLATFADMRGAQGETARSTLTRPAVRISGSQIVLVRPVRFRMNEDTLAPEGEAVLEELRHLLVSTPSIGRIRVDYHSDCSGRQDQVLGLARQRAQQIRRWLIEHGVAPTRVEARAIPPGGSTAPTSGQDCSSAQRRHVQIWIVG